MKRSLETGLRFEVESAGCAAPACTAQRVLDALWSRATVNAAAWDREHKLASALASGSMSVTEAALLRRWALERAGLTARLAYGTGALTKQATPSFPRLAQFDHLFVYLPAQNGLATPMLLDPACRACKAGQVPSLYGGTKVFVFHGVRGLSGVETEGEWVAVDDRTLVNGRLTYTHAVELDAEGTIHDTVRTRRLGTLAPEFFTFFERQQLSKLRDREHERWSPRCPPRR